MENPEADNRLKSRRQNAGSEIAAPSDPERRVKTKRDRKQLQKQTSMTEPQISLCLEPVARFRVGAAVLSESKRSTARSTQLDAEDTDATSVRVPPGGKIWKLEQ